MFYPFFYIPFFDEVSISEINTNEKQNFIFFYFFLHTPFFFRIKISIRG